MHIDRYWRDVLMQNAEALPAYFAEDAIIRWPCTNERFTVPEFIRANCEYPGEWEGELERTLCLPDGLVTVAHVYAKDRALSFHVTSFFTLRDDKISSVDEYWADDGPAPEWRRALGVGRAIR